MAVTDEGYFDWPILPEAPSSLDVSLAGKAAKLIWQVHGGDPTGISVERQIGNGMQGHGRWDRIAKLPPSSKTYSDSDLAKSQGIRLQGPFV
jgi:hypothetical protein